MHAKNGQREPQDLSKFKCFGCQKLGHFTNKCPNGANTEEIHANVGNEDAVNDNMDGIISTLKIDAEDD